jgi:hypothetical protein
VSRSGPHTGRTRHDYWEEVFLLEGGLTDLTLGATFPAGHYACRPPGMPHGPWITGPGVTMLVFTYPAATSPASKSAGAQLTRERAQRKAGAISQFFGLTSPAESLGTR